MSDEDRSDRKRRPKNGAGYCKWSEDDDNVGRAGRNGSFDRYRRYDNENRSRSSSDAASGMNALMLNEDTVRSHSHHLPHYVKFANQSHHSLSDSGSSYVKDMSHLDIHKSCSTASNKSQEHYNNDEDGLSNIREDKPPVQKELSEKDGYYSSGAMSDGNISRRSMLSVESASDSAYAECNRHHCNTSIGGGSIGSAHNAGFYQPSEACKSDIATICSSSMIDEMELSSMLSGENNNNVPNFGGNVQPPCSRSSIFYSSKQKNSGGNLADLPSSSGRHVSMQEPPMVLNDMGPPLSRIIIQQRTDSLTGSRAGSRAGSIGGHSSGSGGIGSDVAHIDTDDARSMTAEIDGYSVRGIHRDEGQLLSETAQSLQNTTEEENGTVPAPLLESIPHVRNGRVSPGGTVYKGRGVRRYQGRYMNLPLKRFQHNSEMNGEVPRHIAHAMNGHRHRDDSDRKIVPHFQNRDRSRSRSRSGGEYTRRSDYSRNQSYDRQCEKKVSSQRRHSEGRNRGHRHR